MLSDGGDDVVEVVVFREVGYGRAYCGAKTADGWGNNVLSYLGALFMPFFT